VQKRAANAEEVDLNHRITIGRWRSNAADKGG
jgi:hypothetical protein